MQGVAAESVLDRMVRAVEAVRDRLLRATAALDSAEIPYVVVGDQAVASWVAAVDKSAVRNSPEVEILIDRRSMAAVKATLGNVGFVYIRDEGKDIFLEGQKAKGRDSLRVYFAGETERPGDLLPNPDVEGSVLSPSFRVLNLGPLVIMCLSANRNIDRLRLRDLIDVGLVDDTWPDHLPPELAERLRSILATPEG